MTVCSECGATIEFWPAHLGPGGWYAPDTHDLGSPGDQCPVGGPHEPTGAFLGVNK